MMLQRLPTRRKVKHGAQELQKGKSPLMLHQGPSQPRHYEHDLQRLQQMGFICPNMPNGGGSVMVRQIQPQDIKPEPQIKKEQQELQQLGVRGLTGGGSLEPLPQGPPQPQQIKKEPQELRRLGVRGLTGGGSLEPLPQGPSQPQQIKKEPQEQQQMVGAG